VAVLVTRPSPDNEKTAAALRAHGYEVLLAPMLRFEALPFEIENARSWTGIVVTSANAVRALATHQAATQMKGLPLFAVGDHTAEIARQAGFSAIMSAAADSGALRRLIVAKIAQRSGKGARGALLYLAGENLSRDLERELGQTGLSVVTRTVYRMAKVRSLPPEAAHAFAQGTVEAILHFSARSARAFVEAVGETGLEISALALPQICLSAHVASVLRDAGAGRIVVAEHPDESHLIHALMHVLPSAASAGKP
jgi:uroporphyrinogen-III synthase